MKPQSCWKFLSINSVIGEKRFPLITRSKYKLYGEFHSYPPSKSPKKMLSRVFALFQPPPLNIAYTLYYWTENWTQGNLDYGFNWWTPIFTSAPLQSQKSWHFCLRKRQKLIKPFGKSVLKCNQLILLHFLQLIPVLMPNLIHIFIRVNTNFKDIDIDFSYFLLSVILIIKTMTKRHREINA